MLHWLFVINGIYHCCVSQGSTEAPNRFWRPRVMETWSNSGYNGYQPQSSILPSHNFILQSIFIPVFIVLSYFKVGGSLREGFLESPRLPCFIDESRMSLPEGKNILGIFSNLLEAAPFFMVLTSNFRYFSMWRMEFTVIHIKTFSYRPCTCWDQLTQLLINIISKKHYLFFSFTIEKY